MMEINELNDKLNLLGKEIFDFDSLLDNLKLLKKEKVHQGDEAYAKKIWIIEQIVEIHKIYVEAFDLLKSKKYYDSWCKLERIEIIFIFLKKHLTFDKRAFSLFFIEKCVKNLQAIFPYRLFSSIELLEKEKKCSICNQIVSLRKPCGHEIGEIYNGELCLRIITNAELLGIALVENPVNKYTVMFITDPETNEKTDQYNYEAIDFLMDIVESPYEPWDLEIQIKYLPHSDYANLNKTDYCPCGSGKKYEECCLNREGVKYQNFEYLVKNPTDKRLLINTIK